VLHTNPDNINWLFDPWMNVKETIVKCNYNIDAEDMIPITGSTFITIDQMRTIRDKVKYEAFTLDVKEDERKF
jgi:hypothetical protein